MQEEWRDCIGFGSYEVSNLGNVRNKRTGRIKKTRLQGNLSVCCFYAGYGRGYYNPVTTVYVHTLVAEAFIGKKDDGNWRIKHKDANMCNNRADNLEYVIHCDYQAEMQKGSKKVKCVETGNIFNSIRECSRAMNIGHMTIGKCANGYQECTRDGYHFVFV